VPAALTELQQDAALGLGNEEAVINAMGMCCSNPAEGEVARQSHPAARLGRTRTPAAPPRSLEITCDGSGVLERVLPSNVVACTALRQLHVRGLRTSDVVSVRALARTLPQCGQLQQLFLHHGQLDGAAIDILAPALSRCNALESLDLSSNAMDDDAVGRLAPRLPGCVELRTLALRENIFREEGVRQLAAALPRCRSLSQLMLFGLQANEAPLVGAKGPRLHLCFNDQPTPPLFTCAAHPPPPPLRLGR